MDRVMHPMVKRSLDGIDCGMKKLNSESSSYREKIVRMESKMFELERTVKELKDELRRLVG